MTENKKTLLSGVKPTGRPHIGNYFGAMRQFVDLQDKCNSYIFIANYHALTTEKDPESLKKDTLDIVIDYLAIGLDPEKTTLYLQSDVPELTELTWIFNCLTTVPYLSRAHAYKDAVANGKEANVGLFDYPMLMASDILIHDPDVVPVGQDQKQHVEIARDTAEKFNTTYGETFKLPEPIIEESVSIVPGTDGRKMSKSYGNTIPLFASDSEIEKAVMSIVTDSKGVEEVKDPEKDNVFAIYKIVAPKDEVDALAKRYKEGGIGYKEVKEILIEELKIFIGPLRDKRKELEGDKENILKILEEGKIKVREKTEMKMKDIREKVGLNLK